MKKGGEMRQGQNENDTKNPVKIEIAAVVASVLYGIVDYKLGGLGSEAHTAMGTLLVLMAAYRGLYKSQESKTEVGKIGNRIIGIIEVAAAIAIFVTPQATEGLLNGIQTYLHSLPDTTAQKPHVEQMLKSLNEQIKDLVQAAQTVIPTATTLPTMTPTMTSTPSPSSTMYPTLDVWATHVPVVASQAKEVITHSPFLSEIGKILLLLGGGVSGIAGIGLAVRHRAVEKSRGVLGKSGKMKEQQVESNPNLVQNAGDFAASKPDLSKIFGTGD